jgi:flagellar hook protein FlgE
MGSAYSNALAGLNANAQAINIVSGNLANLSTSGYKDQQVSFQDLVNQSLTGFSNAGSISGSTIAQSSQSFTQGTLDTTNNPYDAAIQGGGFFVLQGTNGQQLFTREGNFTVDSTGHLVTSTGQYVQGWNAANGVLNANGATSSIMLPTALTTPPVATANITLNANLNSNAVAGAASGTFSSPIQVFDSLGTAHTLTVTYTNTSANNWTYNVTIPSTDVAGGTGATTNVGTGTMTFGADGLMTVPGAAAGTVPISVTGLADGASNLAINWNLYDKNGNSTITQFSQASTPEGSSQDGAAPGQLTAMSIGQNGEVVASFSNGTTSNVAQIALASVLNPGSMQQVSGNSYAATSQTANPVIGLPSTGARGGISGGALETSTVDIATEFTNLLQYERGYQANSKVISTEDQVIQQTIGLIANG